MADKQFADRLKKLAKEKNLNIKTLAEKAQIPYNTLYCALKRGSIFSAEALYKLSQALEVEPIELMPSYM